MIKELIVLNEEGEKIFIETYTPKTTNSTIVFCHGITGCRKGRTTDDDYLSKISN